MSVNPKKVTLTPFTSWVSELGADSLDFIEVIMEIERELLIHLPSDMNSYKGVDTIEDWIKLVRHHLYVE